jgi:hypothetical protein
MGRPRKNPEDTPIQEKKERKPRKKKELVEGKVIGNKKEAKLDIDTKIIELEVDNFLNKYNINVEIENFINQKLDKCLDEQVMLSNLGKRERLHQKVFGIELYEEILAFTDNLISTSIEKELDRDDFHTEKSKLIHQDIMKNINSKIALTMFEDSLPKIDLIAFHYLLKILEDKATNFLNRNELKNIRGYKVSIELFKFEIIDIIGKHKGLSHFTQTIRSIIEQLLVKYNARTKIGQFYYNILMITPDYIVEKVLRYILFTALKNMNPIYLRAIFSTYVGLIHTNLFSFYGAKLTKVKAGYFKQLESLFEENFAQELNSYPTNTNQMVMDTLLITYCMHNKKYLKPGYEFLLDEFSNSFFDTNYYDMLYSFSPDFSILDYMYYYNKVLKATNNSHRPGANLYRINHLFTKKSNPALKAFTLDMVQQQFGQPLYAILEDKDSVQEICKIISEELINKLNPNNFVDQDFNKEIIGLDKYYAQIQMAVTDMKKMIPV